MPSQYIPTSASGRPLCCNGIPHLLPAVVFPLSGSQVLKKPGWPPYSRSTEKGLVLGGKSLAVIQGMDGCLTPRTKTNKKRLCGINRGIISRSVSTLGYLNRAGTCLAVTFPAGKLWGLVQGQQWVMPASLAALLFPLKPRTIFQPFWWKMHTRFAYRHLEEVWKCFLTSQWFFSPFTWPRVISAACSLLFI